MNFLKWLIDILFGWVPYVPKATWNLIKFDLTGSKPYRIRLIMFYLGLVFMWLWYLLYSDGSSDASTICPPYTQLQTDSGMLDEWKNGRMYVWRLKRPDGTQITFHQEYTIDRVLDGKFEYDENGYDTPKPALIKWFKLPSNTKWISELTLDGQKLVSYEQRCKDLKEFGKYCEKLLIDGFIFLAIALFMIVLEARSLKNNYIRGE